MASDKDLEVELRKIGASFSGPERWDEAVDQLEGAHLLKHEMSDLKLIVAEIKSLVEEEVGVTVRAQSWDIVRPVVMMGAVVGVSAWYKNRLESEVGGE
jgi:hypothetical protein